MTLAVRGMTHSAEIRALLLRRGAQSFRKLAGYIPDVMSLENEPQPMLNERGWRVAAFQSRWHNYHVDWVEQHYGFWFERGGYSRMWKIPWAAAPHPE